MRKISDYQQTFEKYAITHQDVETLFNQTFFLNADDAQAEGALNSQVMNSYRGDRRFEHLTNLASQQSFQKVVKELVTLTKNEPHNTFFVKAEELEKYIQALLTEWLPHNGISLYPCFISVYATPHKGLDTLKIDIPSNVKDPAAFMTKIQELYASHSTPVACLNLTLTTPAIRRKETLPRVMWFLNRIVFHACRNMGHDRFVPGTVNVFASSLRAGSTDNAQIAIDNVMRKMVGEFDMYARDETFCQWLYRMYDGHRRAMHKVDEHLANSVEQARRNLSELLGRGLSKDDFNDFAGSWVLNRGESGSNPNLHHVGYYIQVQRKWEEERKGEALEVYAKRNLNDSKTHIVQAAYVLHCQLYQNDEESFMENLKQLLA